MEPQRDKIGPEGDWLCYSLWLLWGALTDTSPRRPGKAKKQWLRLPKSSWGSQGRRMLNARTLIAGCTSEWPMSGWRESQWADAPADGGHSVSLGQPQPDACRQLLAAFRMQQLQSRNGCRRGAERRLQCARPTASAIASGPAARCGRSPPQHVRARHRLYDAPCADDARAAAAVQQQHAPSTMTCAAPCCRTGATWNRGGE
jgi:hypothetical protein